MNWFIFTLLSTVIYGLINFMYKVAAIHKLSSHQILNRSATAVSVSSFVLILITQSEFSDVKQILFFAAINSTFFALGTISKISSLKNIPSSFAFPITKLNAAFLLIYALILFNEQPTIKQWLGITISFSILAYISVNINQEKVEQVDRKKQIIGVSLALLAAFSTSISMLTGKFASTEVPKLNYIFISYTCLLYTSPSPRDRTRSRMPSSA